MRAKNDGTERGELFPRRAADEPSSVPAPAVGAPARLPRDDARYPLDAYASKTIADSHDDLRQAEISAVDSDDEVVDEHCFSLSFFSTISTALMSAPTLAIAVATNTERS